MFCSSCGSSVDGNHKFCAKCGVKVASSVVAEKAGTSESTKHAISTPIRFKEYKESKERERANHFRATKGKRKRPAEDLEESVKVNVGIMLYDDSTSKLKQQRAKGLPINLKKNSTKDELLKTSLEKHAAHSKDMINPRLKYEIVYSDGTVVDKLKESNEDFVLFKYKSECGKPYQRISFHLCSTVDYGRARLQSCLKSDSEVSSDSESGAEERKEKQRGNSGDGLNSGLQSTITNYTINVGADQCSTSTGQSTHSGPSSSQNITASLSECSSFNVITIDVDKDSANSLPSKCRVDDTLSGKPAHCPHAANGNAPMNMIPLRDGEDLSFTTLMEMFPQLDQSKICEALTKGDFNIELAVAYILSGSQANTPQQVYAAFDFCNEVDANEHQEERNDDALEPFENVSELAEDANDISLGDVIKDFSAGKFNPESSLRLKIRRSHVWQDAIFKLQKCSESDFNKLIKVQFVGEPAVDQGGPRNEFFSLLHKEVAASSLFIGEPQSKCFNHNVIALEKKEYLLYGQLCSLGILQGSPSPCFFSPVVADYIVYGKLGKVSACVKNLPNAKAEKKLEELMEICDPEKFKQVASFDCALRFKAGYSKPVVTIEDKNDLIRCISLHYSLLSGLVELEQFIEGLKLKGLLHLLRKHPKSARHLFMLSSENQITAEKLDELFNCIFSPQGSNKRAKEEAVALNFSLFLEAVEANEVKSKLLDVMTDEETEITLSLSDILQFITGSSTLPATGFLDKPSIEFEHDEPHRKLHVSTCSNTLILPVNNTMMEFESFKNEFSSCLVMSPGFGTV